jgi:YHS domain-containing protein
LNNFLNKEAINMADSTSLAQRIDAEFLAVAEKMKGFQVQQTEEYKGRQERLAQLTKAFDELREVWKPRLELLLKKFGDRVQAKPRIVPSTREVTFEFQARLARVRLQFAASTDRDVRKVILTYDLEVIPMLMQFNPHSEIEFPLNAVDKEAAGKWIDDRIVEFVKTYLSLGDNEHYLKDLMVEDPIAGVRFPNIAAACMLEFGGKKYYFVGEETRREFAKQNNITLA